MLKVEIEIPYPLTAAILAVGIFATIMTLASINSDTVSAAGGEGGAPEMVVYDAERDARKTRIERALLERQEEILRYELRHLEEAYRLKVGKVDPSIEDRYRQAIATLVEIIQDKQEAEQRLLSSFREIWDVQDRARVIAQRITPTKKPIRLIWPLQEVERISALFKDPEYKERFGMEHLAIDMPVEQGTPVYAAADGVIEEVNDNGLGYNSVVVSHDGFVTVYGHVESFLVQPGQPVRAGAPIAYSGGMPGTPGAGHLTTGPHLHMELIVDGYHRDPLNYLPEMELSME